MYTPNYSDLQLFDIQQFENSLRTERSTLTVFRNALKQGDETLKARFQAHLNATEYVTQRAWLIDQIISQIWQHCCVPLDPEGASLIAVGGYGRGELHPASDIDLLILLHSPLEDFSQDCIERFVMFLWDLRLEIGHSVRTLAECEEEAINDVTVITNLMETRLLVGNAGLFAQMQARLSPDRLWSSKDFFACKIQEKMSRHQKYHDTAYNLEPNIKEGPGGLRDIQMIGWVVKRHFNADTLHDLVYHGFLTEDEYQTLTTGQEFLWQIRCLLHILSGRREDRLLFDYQRTLATKFGYYDDNSRLGVEKFMRRYYRMVKELTSLNDMLLQLFREVILHNDTPTKLHPLNKRFQVRNGFIEVTHDKIFMHYPFALLEIFLLIQQHPEIKGIRASTLRLIRQYNWLIDEAFHRDLRARSLFFEIIRQPSGITNALRQMNHYGVLGAYIPSFGKIVGQMQYDLFHVYTVDQHSLFVVHNLRHFALPKYRHEFPLCSEIMASLPKSELLYLSGLFHDIAKGRGGDHSELGELEALNFCQAHGLSDYDARFVAWLVRQHLVMSKTAQRQDLSNPDVINTFAQKVGDSMHLDYLYLLTVADIRATNPNLWNGWKDMLLADLYHKTQHVLHHGLEKTLDKQVRVQQIKDKARNLLYGKYDNRVATLWDALGDDYFLCSSPPDITYETQAILNHTTPDIPLVLEREDKQGGSEFVMIYARDHMYLFANTTYFLEQQNLNIVEAYIIPTYCELTISGYTVLEADGSEITSQERVETILRGLREALIRNATGPFYPINRHIPRQLRHFPVPTRITFTQDRNNDYTVLEVVTTDRPGVLSRVAQAFVTCEVRVKKAKIATFGSRVEDIFFITDYLGHALYSADRLDCLREELLNLLDIDLSTTLETS